MIIDNTPIINELNRTFEVEFDINLEEELSIFINGLAGIHVDDIEDITNNIITIKADLGLDYSYDEFTILYTKI